MYRNLKVVMFNKVVLKKKPDIYAADVAELVKASSLPLNSPVYMSNSRVLSSIPKPFKAEIVFPLKWAD